VRAAGSPARALALCCVLCVAGCRRAGERAPKERITEVSDVLPGSWVQVWPAGGALDTLQLRSNGDVAGSVRALNLPFEYHEHLTWRTDFAPMPGGLCIAEGPWTGGVRAIACDGFRIAGDTLLLVGGARYMRFRPGQPAIAAWSGSAGFALAPAPGDSVHALAIPTPRVTLGPIQHATVVPKKPRQP
jgi:hypothetical protein